jgi:DNA (cytosine-5)-methyltransferase 1
VLSSEPSVYRVIELFSGAGGLALGLENAGFKSELLVEIDNDSCKTLKINRANWNVVRDDIKNISFEKYRGNVDVVAGGFPCQAFSYAGKGLGFEDTRGTMFFEFARCLNEVQPKIAIGENVKGLLKHDKGRTLKTMLSTLAEIGYKPFYGILRAQFLDVPQKRERLIIIGIRKDLNIRPKLPKEKNYILTLRDVLHHCPESPFTPYSARKSRFLELIPPGGYWKDLSLEMQKDYMGVSFYRTGGKTGMARRLTWNEPSLTLTCNPSQKHTERCHPSETRPLTVREYARIQTFPDEWEFAGSISSKYKQIGNAVPVNLAYHLGRSLIVMLNESAELHRKNTRKSSIKQNTEKHEVEFIET